MASGDHHPTMVRIHEVVAPHAGVPEQTQKENIVKIVNGDNDCAK
jgi:hypothetical protein